MDAPAGKPITLEMLWAAIPKAWIVALMIGGLAAKLIYGTAWIKDNYPDKAYIDKGFSEVNNAITDMKKYVDAKSLEDRKYTDSQIRDGLEKVIAHSDHNHDDMQVKFSGAAAKLESISDEVKNTQAMVQQMLLDAVPKNRK